CVKYTLQNPSAESGPPFGHAFEPPVTRSTGVDVPYHATSTRPSSPAAAVAKTLFARPGVGICAGADQWLPSSVEYEYMSALSPAFCATESYGACSQTA